MQRRSLLILIIVAATTVAISSIGTFLPHQLMMGSMGRMMGEGSGFGVMPGFFWPTLFTASAAAVIVAAAYAIAYPSIKYSTNSSREDALPTAASASVDPMEIVMRVVRPDERRALEILRSSGGTCLQKDITYKSGLSKLKTHRIVARLAERGIVEVRKVGKTNEITVPAWLKASGSTDEAAKDAGT